MPIYEYACQSCEHAFELIQRMGAPPPDACPECGDSHVRKLVSTTSFRLRGSGWYKDGYGLKSGSGSSSEPTAKDSSKPTAKEESTAKAAAK